MISSSNIANCSMPQGVMLESSGEQSSCETVLERTVVEAFVKMIVCRQVTVQTISAKDGQVLESNTKLEEDQPVILKVNKHEMTNYMSSGPFSSPSTSAKTSSSVPSSHPSPSTFRQAAPPPPASPASPPSRVQVRQSPASLFLRPESLITSPEVRQAMVAGPAGSGQSSSSAQHYSSPQSSLGGEAARQGGAGEGGQPLPRSGGDCAIAGNRRLDGKSVTQETSGGRASSWHVPRLSNSDLLSDLISSPRESSPRQRSPGERVERRRSSFPSSLYLEPVEVPRGRPKEAAARSGESSFLLGTPSEPLGPLPTSSPRCSQVTSSQVDSGGSVPVVVVKIEDDDEVPAAHPSTTSTSAGQERSSRYMARHDKSSQPFQAGSQQHKHQQPQQQQAAEELQQMEYGGMWYSPASTASASSGLGDADALQTSGSDFAMESDLMVMAESSGQQQPESLDFPPTSTGSLDSLTQGLPEGQAGGYSGEAAPPSAPGPPPPPTQTRMATGMEKSHFISPELVNRWICRFCNRSMPSYGSLVTHMKNHNPNRPFQCTYCKKTFAQSCVLKTHIRTHTGEKPYVCSQCGKGFTQAGHLASHKKFHSGIRPFVCNVCSKRFIQKSDLVKHSKIHLRDSLLSAAAAGAGAGPPPQ